MQKCYWSAMNFRQLRAFAMIVDAGGFARAAARLHVSQPALSRQILTLEDELGVPLFDRGPHRVRLTSQGEEMLRHCRRVLTEMEALKERARRQARPVGRIADRIDSPGHRDLALGLHAGVQEAAPRD
jgi:DNA-binding transcriptional LysR family regulator